MRRINVKEKTENFNKCRQSNQNKTFFYEEFKKLLSSIGIPTSIFDIMNKHDVFDKQIIDGRTLYSFKNEPIHTSFMERVYNEKREQVKSWNKKAKAKANGETPLITQQQAWETLLQAGVIKTKLNINTLKSKYPKVYLDCLEYELNVTK